MQYIFRILLLVGVLALKSKLNIVQASNPYSTTDVTFTASSNKSPTKTVFGLYERNGRSAEKFECSQAVVESDTDDGYRTKLPLQISATQGSLDKRYISHIKASLLTTIIFGLIYLLWRDNPSSFLSFDHGRNNRLFLIAAITLYLIEAITCSTRRYLSNVMTPTQVKEYLEKLKSAPPVIMWNIENYHYRTRYYYDYDQRQRRGSHTTTKRDKIVTSRFRQQYGFESWKDETETSTLNRLLFAKAKTTSSFVKITISKLLLFANSKSYRDYINQESIFRTINKRDMYSDFSLHYNIDGYLPKLLAVHNSENGLAKSLWFWIFTFCFMTVPYRIWFARQCIDVDVTLTKEVTTYGNI